MLRGSLHGLGFRVYRTALVSVLRVGLSRDDCRVVVWLNISPVAQGQYRSDPNLSSNIESGAKVSKASGIKDRIRTSAVEQIPLPPSPKPILEILIPSFKLERALHKTSLRN